MRTFLLLIIFLSSFQCYALEEVKISLGKAGEQHLVSGKGFTTRVKIADYMKDPGIYIYSATGDYHVVQYEISVVNNGQDLIGPFVMDKKIHTGSVDKLFKHIGPGSRIFYENIIISCKDCSDRGKRLRAPSIAVILE